MAYVIGEELAKLITEKSKLEEVLEKIIYRLDTSPESRKPVYLFLRGLEDTLNTEGRDSDKERFLVEAAKIAKKIIELDHRSILDPRAMIRITEYEEFLASKELYGYAADIAGLVPTEEAWKRIEGYIEKSTNSLREHPKVLDAEFGGKKVKEILEEKAKEE